MNPTTFEYAVRFRILSLFDLVLFSKLFKRGGVYMPLDSNAVNFFFRRLVMSYQHIYEYLMYLTTAFSSMQTCHQNRLLCNDQIDISFITESWLHSGIPDDSLDPNSKYSVVRRDRPDQRGGGVCIMIDKKLPYCEITCDTANAVKLISIDIVLGIYKSRFVNLYRPPTRSAGARPGIDELIGRIKQLCSVK